MKEVVEVVSENEKIIRIDMTNARLRHKPRRGSRRTSRLGLSSAQTKHAASEPSLQRLVMQETRH